MIKNGGNGSFRVVFPLVRLVSSLQGFNSSGIRFLNFFNDPRIIWEQRIAALRVIVRRWGVREGVQAIFSGVEVYEVGLMVWLLVLAAVAYLGKRRAMWPSLLTKRRSKLLGKLLRDI
ncbi:hypothetical protein Tco_0401381 [Tanacetum coccineum]